MSSEVKVNKLSPATGTDVTLGDASDTFTLPASATIQVASSGEIDIASGATLDVNGTLDVTGATVTGLSAGKILQVTTNSYNTTATATDETVWSDSGITGSITPASTDNKVLIFAVVPCFTSALSETYTSRTMQLALCRGTGVGTVIHNCQFPMGRNIVATSSVQASSYSFVTLVFLDSPATESSQTYTIGYKPPASKIAVQTCQGDTAWVTCMEVEG